MPRQLPPAPPRFKGPAPVGSMRGPLPPTTLAVDDIVRAINLLDLSADEAERIAVIAASRASRPRFATVKREHVLALLDGATITTDEAKLIGLRAIRRARALEDMRKTP